MSEAIPESIPTSISHPSNRATKKLRPTPFSKPNATALSQQANQISTLMSNPDIRISMPPPPSKTASKSGYTPPEIVANVQGSSAGAGSGEFHVYKASRRREYERVRGMEEEAKREKEDEEWERQERERRERDERETEKKKKARERRKGKNKGSKSGQSQAKDGEALGQEGKGKDQRARGLQIPKRQGDDVDAEFTKGGSDAGRENGEQPATERQEETGVVIHDDD